MREKIEPHRSPRARITARLGLATLALLAVAAFLAPAAGAVVTQDEGLGVIGSYGSGAGQLKGPRAVATDPANGEVFVYESGNKRISVFSPWGEFRRAWGWGVATGASALETCTTTCEPGSAGVGAGQFSSSVSGLVVDGDHNVFVVEFFGEEQSARVQKFSPDGKFLLMFGGEVNKSTGANICTAASGDECGAGVKGTGAGFFSSNKLTGIAEDPSGNILVGDTERIQKFSPEGEYLGEISGGVLSGSWPRSFAVDQTSGDIYVVPFEKENVYRLDPTGALVDELEVRFPVGVATDSAGTVFVIDGRGQNHPEAVLQFDSSGTLVGEVERDETEGGSRSLSGLATNGIGDLYVSHAPDPVTAYLTFFGPPPLKYGSPPKVPPTIDSQFASQVGVEDAGLGAQINPRFWADTSYYVEYGAGSCAAGECDSVLPAPPGTVIGKAANESIATAPIHLSGLQPNTTYHYRFVSQSGGGGPVYGVDPDGDEPEEASPEEGLEGTFTTFAAEGDIPPCPNDAFRTGAAALLPECRAYEMVTPVEKLGADVLTPINITGFENRLNQSSLDGESLTYSAYRAFGGSKSASYVSQYIASRDSGGWSTETLAEQRGAGFYGDPRATENEFKAFSSDLCHAWVLSESEPLLAPGAVAGFPNLYRRDNCPEGYTALSTTSPPNLAPDHFDPELQGYAADGSRAIFRANDNLTANSPPQPSSCVDEEKDCLFRLYEASAGGLSLVCILPDGTPYPGDCSAGSPSGVTAHFRNRSSTVDHAMSEDGSRIYWSTNIANTGLTGESGLGKIYLRLDGTTTVEVSGKASSAEARFWGASPDGSKALFSIEDQEREEVTIRDRDLYEYDLESESASKIAGKLVGVAAHSEDLSRVYFVSEEAIDGEGTPGKANLYLRDEGTVDFIATLSERDVRIERGIAALPSNAAPSPIFHVAQATPDGERLAFISNEPLTGADNTDASSGQADSEVFTYAAESGELTCASCSPAGARPVGRLVQAPGNSGFLWTAASLPLGSNQLFTPRALSEDGNRLFFTAYADLLPRDRNGKADVYEWERAGAGESCEGEEDPDFYPANGGCLFLISSGRSPQDSELVDSSPSGRDVFFTTQESLLVQDRDLQDIYDARIGGGFEPPPIPVPPCEGEACQPEQPAPAFQSPLTGQPRPGNPPRRKLCPRTKHRVVKGGRERCVRNKGKGGKGKNRSSNNGRSGR